MRKPKETLSLKEGHEVVATLTIRHPLVGETLQDLILGLTHYLHCLESDERIGLNGRRYRDLPIYHFGRRQLVHIPYPHIETSTDIHEPV